MEENLSQTTRVTVNTASVLANKRYAFTTSTAVIAELMQNARRAGATQIDLRFPVDGELIATDDGAGIQSFDRLLELGGSGWDAQTAATEHPFGEGFFSAIFGASHVEVSSNGKRLAFDTARALEGDALSVVDDAPRSGTMIRLCGLRRTATAMVDAAKTYAAGFPIPVFVDGKEVKRPDAMGAGFESIAGVGMFRMNHENRGGCVVSLYLQGLPVGVVSRYLRSSGSYNVDNHVLHLDSAHFNARLPDRDCLIDQEEFSKRLHQTIVPSFVRDLLRREMLDLHDDAEKAAWIERNWRAAKGWRCMDLIGEFDVLPMTRLSRVLTPDGRAGNEDYTEPMQYSPEGDSPATVKWVSRFEVESGSVALCKHLASCADGTYSDTDDGFDCVGGWPSALLAHRKDWLRVPAEVGESHWAWKEARDLSELAIQVRMSMTKSAKIALNFVYGKIHLCEHFDLCWEGDVERVNDESVCVDGCGDDNSGGHDSEVNLIVPAGCTGQTALSMASSFAESGNDYFTEDGWDEDARGLRNIVIGLTEGPSNAVAELLRQSDWHSLKSLDDSATLVLTHASKLKVLDAKKLLDAVMLCASGDFDPALGLLKQCATGITEQVNDIRGNKVAA